MRLEELVLRIPGDEFRVHFHEHLTVLSGIGLLERQALADSVLQALAGTAESTELRYTDATGRLVQVLAEGGRATATYLDDGSPALPLVGTVAPTDDDLRRLVLVRAEELGLAPARAGADDDPELAEARATLAELTSELQAAITGRQEHDQHVQEREHVAELLREAEEGEARRAYAAVLARLEELRAEEAALDAGEAGAARDRHLVTAAASLPELLAAWQDAAARVAALREREDGAEPAADLDALRLVPDAPPADLRARLDAVARARAELDRLQAGLHGDGSGTFEPSQPEVIDLARADQAALWATAERVERATDALKREQLALGGAGHEPGVAEEVARRIEDSQRQVEAAEAVLERNWTPAIAGGAVVAVSSLLLATVNLLLGPALLVVAVLVAGAGIGLPWRGLQAAKAAQQAVLDEVGASTYLAFHLRRVDAATDREAHSQVEAAAVEHRRALEAWSDLAPGIPVALARSLEGEVHVLAAGLAQQDDAATGLEARRAEIVGRAEPQLRAAREALRTLVEPYGVDAAVLATADAAVIERLVLDQVDRGRLARTRMAADEAIALEAREAARLDDLLLQLGYRDGDRAERARAVLEAVERAAIRVGGASGRSRAEVEADIERVRAEAERLARPEWGPVRPDEAAGPSAEALRRRYEELEALLAADEDVVIDLERLADRHSAMERRVATLEAQHHGRSDETTIGQLADVQQLLLGHLAAAAHVGPFDESLPVVLDEVFLRVAAERKWELLDMIRRLGEKTQLVYLTDDPYVTAWARRRAAAGLVTLLEPIDA